MLDNYDLRDRFVTATAYAPLQGGVPARQVSDMKPVTSYAQTSSGVFMYTRLWALGANNTKGIAKSTEEVTRQMDEMHELWCVDYNEGKMNSPTCQKHAAKKREKAEL